MGDSAVVEDSGAKTSGGPTRLSVWAVTSTWRGDVKLFGRIVEKAIEEVGQVARTDQCAIEFAVRDDRERYESAEKMIDCAPPSTLRSFNSARIEVGGDALRVEVRIGRKKPHKNAAFSCPFGVAVEVSSDGSVSERTLCRIRDGIVRQIGRGGFSWGRPPTPGPGSERTDLEAALNERWVERHAVAQTIFAAVTVLVALVVTAVYLLVELDSGSSYSSVSTTITFLVSVLIVVQVASFPISTFLFPAIEIADLTPGRRIAQIVGRSGVVTAIAGVAGAYLKTLVG